MRPIDEVAHDLGIDRQHLQTYGNDKAKVDLGVLDGPSETASRLVLVTAITPTPAGEGKTTTSIGLAQGMKALGKRVAVALREPSLGPCMGVKGGATGGGLSCVHPGDDINLHFTGDFHAITSANNLLAAMVDNALHHGTLDIDPRRVAWRRVMDMNERALRNCVIGLGGISGGTPRETGFDITAASEVMAVLCLADGHDDLRARLARIAVAFSPRRGGPVTAEDVGATGPMMALLNDAIKPNLVQTTEGVPALVHGGPFANIAHGCNSVLATRVALHGADWVITEAGFGCDLGAEKFVDIKCRSAGLAPDVVVLVATIRALKMHGGKGLRTLTEPDPGAVEAGLCNLGAHIDNVGHLGGTPVVALNRFAADSDEEVAMVARYCDARGLPFAVSDHFAQGGQGAVALAEAVVAQADDSHHYAPLYELETTVPEKIEAVATKMYGASGVVFTPEAKQDLRRVDRLGIRTLPVCIAKTQSSLSDNPTRLGRPTDFEITVRGIKPNLGAGFLVVLTGDIMRMPGLPKVPQAEQIDVVDGRVVGVV